MIYETKVYLFPIWDKDKHIQNIKNIHQCVDEKNRQGLQYRTYSSFNNCLN